MVFSISRIWTRIIKWPRLLARPTATPSPHPGSWANKMGIFTFNNRSLFIIEASDSSYKDIITPLSDFKPTKFHHQLRLSGFHRNHMLLEYGFNPKTARRVLFVQMKSNMVRSDRKHGVLQGTICNQPLCSSH